MNQLLKSALYLSLVSTSFVAQAQFKMPSLPGGGNKLSGAQDQLVSQYAAAEKDVLDANGKMDDALGLKDQAAQARAESTALSSGATLNNLEAANAGSSDNDAVIAAAYKNPPEMDAKAKATFTEGLEFLGKGVMKYVAMRSSVTSFGSSLTSVSPTMLPKLQSGAYIVKVFPTNSKNLFTSLNNAVTFAKAHDITVPPDATQALTSSF
jgi:hypothetical protein